MNLVANVKAIAPAADDADCARMVKRVAGMTRHSLCVQYEAGAGRMPALTLDDACANI